MAETKLNKYSVVEKLNKMDVDLIDVEPTVDTSAYAVGDLMFNPVEIENAVAVNGGTSLLHSVSVANDDALTGAFDLVFTASDDIIGTFNNAVSGESGLSDANADLILGITSVTNMVDVGACSVGSKGNIGLVLKAPAGSRSIYVWGISQSTNNPTAGTGYKLRIGIIKD
jgi:hypothetical protein